MTELWQLGALDIATAIRKGETSSRKELGALLARVFTPIDPVKG